MDVYGVIGPKVHSESKIECSRRVVERKEERVGMPHQNALGTTNQLQDMESSLLKTYSLLSFRRSKETDLGITRLKSSSAKSSGDLVEHICRRYSFSILQRKSQTDPSGPEGPNSVEAPCTSLKGLL